MVPKDFFDVAVFDVIFDVIFDVTVYDVTFFRSYRFRCSRIQCYRLRSSYFGILPHFEHLCPNFHKARNSLFVKIELDTDLNSRRCL